MVAEIVTMTGAGLGAASGRHWRGGPGGRPGGPGPSRWNGSRGGALPPLRNFHAPQALCRVRHERTGETEDAQQDGFTLTRVPGRIIVMKVYNPQRR